MHIGPTTGVCYDFQGNVYSGGYDGRVVAWMDRCSDARWVACHDGLVNSLIADDGEIISVGADRVIRRWSTDTGLSTSDRFFETVDDLNLVVASNGKLVVAGEEGKLIAVDRQSSSIQWETTGTLPEMYGDAIQALCLVRHDHNPHFLFGNGQGHFGLVNDDGAIHSHARIEGTIECAAWDGSSGRIYFGMSDGTVCVVSSADLSVIDRRSLHQVTIKSVAVSSSGVVACASYDGKLHICTKDLQVLRTLELNLPRLRGWARGLAFNPVRCQELAVTTLTDRPLLINVDSGVIESAGSTATHGLNCLCVRHGRIIAGGDNGYLWAISSTTTQKLHDAGAMILCVAPHPYKFLIAAGTHDGRVVVVDLTSGLRLAEITVAATPVVSVAFERCGRRLLIGTYSGYVKVLSVDTWREIGHLEVGDSVKAICEVGDGSKMAGAVADGSLIVWDTHKQVLLARNADAFLPNSVAWCSAHRCLLSVSRDMILRAWSEDLRLLQGVAAHDRSTKALAVSPDGHAWATAGYDSVVQIWKNFNKVATCVGHRIPGVPAVCWVDSNTLVSAGWDGTVRMWDMKGNQLACLDVASCRNDG